MYSPAHFQEGRPEALLELIGRHPLGTILVHDGCNLDADHIPLLHRPGATGSGTLAGHVARANPLWQKAGAGLDCLVVFHGPQYYISPGWYATNAESGRVVPTWNYEVVHVHGRIRAVEDPQWIRALLDDLTRTHEASLPHPWKPSDAPTEYLDRLLQAIVGIEIRIDRMIGKAKLSQNQPAANQQSVVEALRNRSDPAAAAMADAITARSNPTAGSPHPSCPGHGTR
jgi:transcriptional regulator